MGYSIIKTRDLKVGDIVHKTEKDLKNKDAFFEVIQIDIVSDTIRFSTSFNKYDYLLDSKCLIPMSYYTDTLWYKEENFSDEDFLF